MQVILVNLNNRLVSLNSTWLAQIAPPPLPQKKMSYSLWLALQPAQITGSHGLLAGFPKYILY